MKNWKKNILLVICCLLLGFLSKGNASANERMTQRVVYDGLRSGQFVYIDESNDGILCFDKRSVKVLYNYLGRREVIVATLYALIEGNRVAEILVATDTSRIQTTQLAQKVYENGRVILQRKMNPILWKNYFGDLNWANTVVKMYESVSH